MALVTGQEHRSGTVTDADGRQFVIDAEGIGNSGIGTGTAGAPAANAFLISAVTTTTGGVYKIRITVTMSGTAETLMLNLKLRNNGSQVCLIPTSPGTQVYEIPRVTAAGGFDLQVVAGATAGSVYTATLVITRVE